VLSLGTGRFKTRTEENQTVLGPQRSQQWPQQVVSEARNGMLKQNYLGHLQKKNSGAREGVLPEMN